MRPYLLSSTCCVFVLLFLLATSVGPAQVPGEKGQSDAGQVSLTLVNALPGPDHLHIKFGQEDIWPPGFTPGQSTAGVLFPSGKKRVQLLCQGFAQTAEEIFMPSRANFAMVLYPGEEIKDGPDKGKRKIGLFCPPPILSGQAPNGKKWSVLLTGSMERTKVEVNGHLMELSKGVPRQLDRQERSVTVKSGDKVLLALSPEVDGNYWVIVFGQDEASLQATVLNHISYGVPQ